MPHARALLFVLAVLLLPASVSAEPADYAPRLVAAIHTDAPDVLLAWAPGEQVAEAYRLYGLALDAPPALLGTVTTANANDTMNAAVPSGYAGYAVSGIVGDVESAMVRAHVEPEAQWCWRIDPTKPDIYIQCLPVVRIERPGLGAFS